MKTTESKYNQCLYFAANALARKVEKLAIESWKPVDLSPSHAYLLMMVLEEPGLQPGCIANHLQLSPSTITRLIEKLEEKKLVIRITEGKTTNVFPSPEGKELMPMLKECLTDFSKSSCDILGKEESKKMVWNMCTLADKLS
ncbi:MarR family winged helix-turn-helix transcriptional regulator [Parasediminibacterium sp. JCM 36343]|uniref:MarR family winged helix-turn-helix transcriptional regulator n=1 Tax=Parasediminibacterium sp. JCM 36343 TaxID=3374279 RepID=UPI00397C6489